MFGHMSRRKKNDERDAGGDRGGSNPNEAQLEVQSLHRCAGAGAGGVVTTWKNEPAQAGGRIIAAGVARVHAAALQMLKREGAPND